MRCRNLIASVFRRDRNRIAIRRAAAEIYASKSKSGKLARATGEHLVRQGAMARLQVCYGESRLGNSQ